VNTEKEYEQMTKESIAEPDIALSRVNREAKNVAEKPRKQKSRQSKKDQARGREKNIQSKQRIRKGNNKSTYKTLKRKRKEMETRRTRN
jgi:hypothetical protein